MGYQRSIEGQLDYSLCRYGQSRLSFRGPRADLGEEYVAFLGGTETFGKYVAAPYPDLVGEVIGRQSVNLGCVNAGLDALILDEGIRDCAAKASACVIQVIGAHMLTNRYYQVHPRRNDRFLAVKPDLEALFPNTDFTDVHFARHLIATLAERSPEGLEAVRQELSTLWVWRMRKLLDLVGKPVVLVWISGRRPEEDGTAHDADDPLFVDQAMLDALRPDVAGIVEIVREVGPRHSTAETGVVPLNEHAAARELPGQVTHFQIAAGVSELLKGLL
jgi:hypothetical protein